MCALWVSTLWVCIEHCWVGGNLPPCKGTMNTVYDVHNNILSLYQFSTMNVMFQVWPFLYFITDSTPHHSVVYPAWLTMVNYWWTNVSISPPPMSRTIGKKWEKYYRKCWEKLFLKNLEPALLRCRFNIEFCTKEGGGASNNSGWMSVKWMRKRNLPDTRQTENFVIVFGKLSRK